jgi:hypothetical protein
MLCPKSRNAGRFIGKSKAGKIYRQKQRRVWNLQIATMISGAVEISLNFNIQRFLVGGGSKNKKCSGNKNHLKTI